MGFWKKWGEAVVDTLGIPKRATGEIKKGLEEAGVGKTKKEKKDKKKREEWFDSTNVAMEEVIEEAERVFHEIRGTLTQVNEEAKQLQLWSKTLKDGTTKSQVQQVVQHLGHHQSPATPATNTPETKWSLAYIAVGLNDLIDRLKAFRNDFVAGKKSYIETPNATDLDVNNTATNKAMMMHYEDEFWNIVDPQLERMMTSAVSALAGFSKLMEFTQGLRAQAVEAHKAKPREEGKPTASSAFDVLDGIDF